MTTATRTTRKEVAAAILAETKFGAEPVCIAAGPESSGKGAKSKLVEHCNNSSVFPPIVCERIVRY